MIYVIGFGVPTLFLLLGFVAGKFLATWIIFLLSFVCCVLLFFEIREVRPRQRSNSGSIGGGILGLWVLLSLILFLLAMWLTYIVDYRGDIYSTVLSYIKRITILR